MLRIKDSLAQYWKTLSESWRYAILAFLVLRLFYALWSSTILAIQPLAVQNIDLSGEPVLTIFNLQDSQAYAYRREVQGQRLTFRAAQAKTVTDQQTGSIWDISTGSAVAGQLEGLKLSPSKTPTSKIFPYNQIDPYPVGWLAVWQRFDVNWYLSIAENGYGKVVGDIHFPPLYPMLIRFLTPIFGEAFLAGLFVSHVAALYAIKLLYDTFVEWGGNLLAKRTVFLILIFPTSFFLFSAYTESVFLVTVLLSLRYMRKRSWLWGGFWAFCAILTRLQGAALIVPLIYSIWQDRPALRKLTHWVSLGLPTLGGLLYLYLRSRQVSSQVLPLVESELHTRMVPPWQSYWYGIQTLLSNQSSYIDILNLVVATFFIVLLVTGWQRIPTEYSLFAAFSLLIMLSRITETQPLSGMSRFALTLFPSFFVLGLITQRPWLQRLINYAFLILNLYLSAQFFSWGWVA